MEEPYKNTGITHPVIIEALRDKEPPVEDYGPVPWLFVGGAIFFLILAIHGIYVSW